MIQRRLDVCLIGYFRLFVWSIKLENPGQSLLLANGNYIVYIKNE